MKRRTVAYYSLASAILLGAALARFSSEVRNSRQASVYIDQANLLTKKGDWPGAIRNLEKAVEVEPDCFEAREGLSYFYLNTKRLPDAIAVLEAGERIAPQDRGRYQYALCDIYDLSKNYPKAVACLRESIEEAPPEKLSQRRLCMLLERAGEIRAAEAAWLEYRRLFPGDASAERGLARIQRQRAERKAEPAAP